MTSSFNCQQEHAESNHQHVSFKKQDENDHMKYNSPDHRIHLPEKFLQYRQMYLHAYKKHQLKIAYALKILVP